ncbi:MAG: DUF2948 family protein [Hyphomicrobiaceae bacterium]
MADPDQPLKLLALDTEDLAILSAHLQDSVLKVGDMTFLPRERRFAAVLNRFVWEKTFAAGNGKAIGHERRQSALRFEGVLKARLQNIRLDAKRDVLELLAIQFEPTTAPAGDVTLIFAGGAAIRLEVEYVEAELKDLGPSWRTRHQPAHPADDGSG